MYRKSPVERLFNGVLSIAAGIVAIVCFYPFLYMIMVSLSSLPTLGRILVAPRGFSVRAYVELFEGRNIGGALLISVFRSTVGPVSTIIVIYLGAYALAQNRLVFRKFFTIFIVFSMYFTAGLLPTYVNISQLGLVGSIWVYILPLLPSTFSLILIRTFIQELPDSLSESAYVDGANDLQIGLRVILPVCKPVLAAVLLFQFVAQWNLYEDTLLYNAHVPELHTLQYVLSTYIARSTVYTAEEAMANTNFATLPYESIRMALTVFLCVPVAIVYPFLQKYFVKGLLIGSIKG